MYTYTPTHKFLVLSPVKNGPESANLNQSQYETSPSSSSSTSPSQGRERSGSQSSISTNYLQTGAPWSPLPDGFLYLGYEKPSVRSSF